MAIIAVSENILVTLEDTWTMLLTVPTLSAVDKYMLPLLIEFCMSKIPVDPKNMYERLGDEFPKVMYWFVGICIPFKKITFPVYVVPELFNSI